MFDRIFNMDNGFWRAMTKVADVVILNLLFVVCSIPIFTIGASATAMYTVMLKLVKNEESYTFKGFFIAFKENFKQSTIIWLILLAVGAFIGVDIYLTQVMEDTILKVLNYIFLVFALLYAMTLSYVFPLQSKFVNTVKNTLKNGLFMSIANFPWTLLILVVTAIPVVLVMVNANFVFAMIPCMIFFGFGAICFVNSFIFNRVFKKYIPEEKEEPDLDEQIENGDTLTSIDQTPTDEIKDITSK